MAPYQSSTIRNMNPAARMMGAENRLAIIHATPVATPVASVYIPPTPHFAPFVYVVPTASPLMASATSATSGIGPATFDSTVQALGTQTITVVETSANSTATSLPSLSAMDAQHETSTFPPSASPTTDPTVTSQTFSYSNQPSRQFPFPNTINSNSVKPATSSPSSSQMTNPQSFDSFQMVFHNLAANKLLLSIAIGLFVLVGLTAVILIVRCCRRRAASRKNRGPDTLQARKRQDSVMALKRDEEVNLEEALALTPAAPLSETVGKMEARASGASAKSRLVYGYATFGGRKWPVAKAIGGRWIWIGTNMLVFKGNTDCQDEITEIKSLGMAEAVWELEEKQGHVNQDFERAWQTLLEML
ncbi:hypothetical protein BC830DRAFT_1091526 [Chytriomyces sp. MP71]|nr:hypothetical protein BC830DRAFT_1091526 [Chytriomyces sp. MP71]